MKKLNLAFLLLNITFILATQIAKAQVRPTNSGDSLALVDLYNSTNGNAWTTGWNFSLPVTTWEHVTTSPAYEPGSEHRVLGLSLSHNNLTGIIPGSIGNLSMINYISFWNNNLSGEIPLSIGNLTQLQSLDLSNNQLTGNIPETMVNLFNLRFLYVTDNNLSGHVPEILGTMHQLQTLNASKNHFRFDGFESIVPQLTSTNFDLWPQDSLIINKNNGILSVTAGGSLSNNTYTWYRDHLFNVAVITGDSTYRPLDNGAYSVIVKNSQTGPNFPLEGIPNSVSKIKLYSTDPNPFMIANDGHIQATVSTIPYGYNVKGIAADGVSKILLITAAANPVTFSLANIQDGSFSSLNSQDIKSNTLTVSPENGKVALIFNAPDGYGNYAVAGGRNIELYTNCVEDTTIQKIRIYTTPVVLVHGMWSDPKAWTKGNFLQTLQAYGFENIETADYGEFSHLTFDPQNIESLYGRLSVLIASVRGLEKYRKKGIACSQVDVIGHSLGGLMTRSFSQWTSQNIVKENYYHGYIHKLITLGTPHFGSPLGPLLYNSAELVRTVVDHQLSDHPLWYITEQLLFEYLYSYFRIGSVHRDLNTDISTNPALQHLQNTHESKIAKVYAIVGLAGDEANPNNSGWSALCNTIFKTPLDHIFNNYSHDLIVGERSQLGGLNYSAAQSFNGTAHSNPPGFGVLGFTTETGNPLIIDKAKYLLLSNEPTDFSDSFPAPSSVMNRMMNSLPNVTGRIFEPSDSGFIMLSPESMNLLPDTSVSLQEITFNLHAGAAVTQAICLIQDIGIFQFSSIPPYTITLPLKQFKKTGKLNFCVVARNNFETLLADSSTIYLKPRGHFLSLEVKEDSVWLDSTAREYTLHPFVKYVEGADTLLYDVDITAGLTFQSLSNNVQVTVAGVLKPQIAGSAVVKIKYKDYYGPTIYEKQVYVKVTGNPATFSKYATEINLNTGNKTISDPPFVLQGSASSGERLRYSLISGPAIIQNDIMILNGAGDIVVKATCRGNAYFDSAYILHTIHVAATPPSTYIFIGNGFWNDPQNWENNNVPPNNLPNGTEIIINPEINGECVVNVPVNIDAGVTLRVVSGKKMRLWNNLKLE
ncbi:MAG: alpha/beta fold hydrolase [Ferruginibacter sp.]